VFNAPAPGNPAVPLGGVAGKTASSVAPVAQVAHGSATAWQGDMTMLNGGERADLLSLDGYRSLKVRNTFERLTPSERSGFLADHPGWTGREMASTWRALDPEMKDAFLLSRPALLRQLQELWNGMTPQQRSQFVYRHPALQF